MEQGLGGQEKSLGFLSTMSRGKSKQFLGRLLLWAAEGGVRDGKSSGMTMG